MQDHEFEKQVHQKIEEMKLRPSDAVWSKVEKGLHKKEKNKRRFVWLPLLLMCLALGGYFFLNSKPDFSDKERQSRLNGQLTKKQNKIDSERHAEKKDSIAGKQNSVTTANTEEAPVIHDKVIAKHKNGKANLKIKKIRPQRNNLSFSGSLNQTININDLTHQSPGTTDNKTVVKQAIKEKHFYQPGSKPDQKNITPEIIYASADSVNNTVKDIFPVTIKSYKSTEQLINTSLGLIINNLPDNLSLQKIKKPGWLWGLTFQAGRSGVTDGHLNSLFESRELANISGGNTANVGFTPGGIIHSRPSKLKAGPGFSLGMFAKKALTRRMTISVGLNYTLYSTTHKVGKKVDSARIVRQSNADQKSIEEYFLLGNNESYNNKYHFFELPVLIETPLTRNPKIPLHWNLGFSLSRLITSNALHFNGSARIYYKDNNLFNRSQLNIITGLPIRFIAGKKYAFQAGPQFQYEISNLIDKQRVGAKHFFFAGLKADFLIRKN